MAAAVTHEVELPDATWANIGFDLSLNYAGISVADAAPELVRTNEGIWFDTGQREPLRVYASHFLAPGTMSVWFGRPDGGVSGVVEAGRRLLLASPETAVYGAVLTGKPLFQPRHLPLVGESDYSVWSQYWDRIVPDAYGVQVLGPAHLERVGDLSGWVTTRLEGDRYLVEARDLRAWFDASVPDPVAQAAARDDFAGIILTADFMELNPVSEVARVRVATAASRGSLAGGDRGLTRP